MEKLKRLIETLQKRDDNTTDETTVLRGWLARRKYARLREIHQLQLVFIRKFSEDISLTGQFYQTKMENHCQYDKKRQLKPKSSDEDDEQIEKTLNFFDSIIDPYLHDQEMNDENKNKFPRKLSNPILPIKTNGSTVQQVKQEFDGSISMNTNTSSSSSSSQKVPQRPMDIHASHFHQFQNIRCRFEQMTSNANNSSTNNVRRYTSENNLNEIASSSKPILQQKLARPPPLQTIASSTEDLTNIPSWKKLSPQARLSALLDKTNHPSSSSSLLTTNGTSASLIDLTSIDKLPTNKQIQPSSRPRFRFVPPSDKNSILKEEPELEQQSNQAYDNFDLKSLSPPRTIIPNNIIKPMVIHPTRSTLFTQPELNSHHHQNGNSAFKPPISHPINHVKSPIPMNNIQQRPMIPTQNLHSNGNGVLYKTQQPPPVPNIKRTESVHKPGVHVGMTNPNGLLTRQSQQTIPQFHQSMLNLSSFEPPERTNKTQPAIGMFGSRVSLQSTAPNFMKHPAYTPQTNKMNGHHQYHHPPPPSQNSSSRQPPPTILEDPIIRWIQQVNNSSSINGLTPNGGGNRSQQSYPYGSYISTSAGHPPPTNGVDHTHRQQTYLNQVNVHKHHTPQHIVPVQSTYLGSPPVSRNGKSPSTTANVYHFSQHNSHQIPSSSGGGGQTRHHPQRQDVTVTTYL